MSFFENFYNSLALIKHEGINGDSVAPDVAVPMVATRDIADAAARALKGRDWNGVVVRELLGPRDLSHVEATRIIGERIGKLISSTFSSHTPTRKKRSSRRACPKASPSSTSK